MILYLDTSALVKLIRREEGSELVHEAADKATALAASQLAKVEVHSALARLRREGAPDHLLTSYLSSFRSLWAPMAQVGMDRAVDAASGLCLKHPLRALDAIHLASALLLREMGGLVVVFATADVRLKLAAQAEGFPTVG